MVDMILSNQKIEPDKTARLKEWMAEIQTREDEAIETLKHEGMHSEAAFLQQAEDGDFLVYYMEADVMDHVFEAYRQSEHEIDHEHQEVLEDVLEDGSDVGNYELLYHLTNPDRPRYTVGRNYFHRILTPIETVKGFTTGITSPNTFLSRGTLYRPCHRVLTTRSTSVGCAF